MRMLQGKSIPVRLNLFLIVNPPRGFNKVWNVMKPMLTENFRQKVHMTPESQLFAFLKPGYEAYLPDDMTTGQVDTDLLVRDFLAYRLYLEETETKQNKAKKASVPESNSKSHLHKPSTIESKKLNNEEEKPKEKVRRQFPFLFWNNHEPSKRSKQAKAA